MSELRVTIDRVRAHLEANPADGEAEDVPVRVSRAGPLSFAATDANGRTVTTDMPPGIGGGGAGMTPGTLLRAGLGSCGAGAIALTAAAWGIELSRLEVDVASRSDDRGVLGIDGVAPEPLEVRITYHLASPDATDDQLRELVAEAERRSPVGQAVRQRVVVSTQVELT